MEGKYELLYTTPPIQRQSNPISGQSHTHPIGPTNGKLPISSSLTKPARVHSQFVQVNLNPATQNIHTRQPVVGALPQGDHRRNSLSLLGALYVIIRKRRATVIRSVRNLGDEKSRGEMPTSSCNRRSRLDYKPQYRLLVRPQPVFRKRQRHRPSFACPSLLGMPTIPKPLELRRGRLTR